MTAVNFTAIDFETANGFRGSACSIGMAKIRDGKTIDTYYQLLKPPAGFDRFDPRNVGIHGITDDQVATAPRFGEAMPEILEFIADDAVLAHNAGFDIGVIESGMEVSELPVPQMHYACSLRLSRKVYDIASHALPKSAAEAGFVLESHHNALADAQACAAIGVDIAQRREADTLEELLSGLELGLGTLQAKAPGEPESRATVQARAVPGIFDATVEAPAAPLPDFMRWQDEGTNPRPNTAADPTNPLYGQHVVFTGQLGISRQDAKNRAAAAGARTNSRITKATTMVIIGDGVGPQHLAPVNNTGATLTVLHPALKHRKMRDALQRRALGQNITVVTEPEFLQMLEENWPDTGR